MIRAGLAHALSLQPKYLNAGMQFSDYAVFCRTISLPATILRQPWQIWSDSSIWLAAGGGKIPPEANTYVQGVVFVLF
jgi:hypothetical protein